MFKCFSLTEHKFRDECCTLKKKEKKKREQYDFKNVQF